MAPTTALANLNRETIKPYFTGVLPKTKFNVIDLTQDNFGEKKALVLKGDWIDRVESYRHPAAMVEIILYSDDDGSVVARIESVQSAEIWRHQGVAPELISSCERLIREIEISQHPNSRIELYASRLGTEASGRYVWALSGMDVTKPRDDGSEAVKSIDDYRHMALTWAHQNKYITSPLQRYALKKLLTDCKHMWELATLKFEDTEDTAFGRTFLTAPETKSWNAVFYVNQPDYPGREIFNRHLDHTRATRVVVWQQKLDKALDILRTSNTLDRETTEAWENVARFASAEDDALWANLRNIVKAKLFMQDSFRQCHELVALPL